MRVLYFFLLIILPLPVFAQSNYRKGYVLKNNGDTLKGYLDYREWWAKTPILIDFKGNKNAKKAQQFSPIISKGFGIDSTMEIYTSYKGLVSWDQNSLSRVAESFDTTKVNANIFLKLITSGKYLSLYSQTDERKTRYFVAEQNDKPIELKYYLYYRNLHDTIEIKPLFRKQLIFYINKYITDNGSLISQVEMMNFHEDELEEIIDEINWIAK